MHKASHSLDQGMVLSSLCLAIRKSHLEDMGDLRVCLQVQDIDLRLEVFWTEAALCSALRDVLESQMKLDTEWLIPLKNKKKFHYDSGQTLACVFQSACEVSNPGDFQNSYEVLMWPWATCMGREIEPETSRSPSGLSYSVTLWSRGDVKLRRTFLSGDARNMVLTGGHHWRVQVTWKLAG